MKKLYLIRHRVSVGASLGPMPWAVYPEGVDLVRAPHVSCDERGAELNLTVRCEPAIGEAMHWLPFEMPAKETASVNSPRIGETVWVRLPSQHACGYSDIPGLVSSVNQYGQVNVVRAERNPQLNDFGQSVAYGQSECSPQRQWGFFRKGSAEWAKRNEP